MGWRKSLRKRRKLARVKKKELYITDKDFRASQDKKKSQAIQGAISIGGAVAKMIPGGKGIGDILTDLKMTNEGVAIPQDREERIKSNEKIRGYKVVNSNEKDGMDQKKLVYIGAAAVALLFLLRK